MQQMTSASGPELTALLQGIGDGHEDEKQVFSDAVNFLLTTSGRVSRKAILFYLIAELESTSDVVRLDVLRSCLEIAVGPSAGQDQ